MVETTKEIVNKLQKYIATVENKHAIRISSAYLYGLFAKGLQHEWSDIDVALVSPDFSGDWFNDKNKIRRTTIDFDYNISPFPCREAAFTPDKLFVKEILKTGIRIK